MRMACLPRCLPQDLDPRGPNGGHRSWPSSLAGDDPASGCGGACPLVAGGVKLSFRQRCQLPTRHSSAGGAPEARAASRATMTIHAIGMRWAGTRPPIVSADLTESQFVRCEEARVRRPERR